MITIEGSDFRFEDCFSGLTDNSWGLDSLAYRDARAGSLPDCYLYDWVSVFVQELVHWLAPCCRCCHALLPLALIGVAEYLA